MTPSVAVGSGGVYARAFVMIPLLLFAFLGENSGCGTQDKCQCVMRWMLWSVSLRLSSVCYGLEIPETLLQIMTLITGVSSSTEPMVINKVARLAKCQLEIG